MRSSSVTGIVLKRSDVGEADRIITFFTKERGKVVVVAKGCRKLSSSRAAALEPGSHSKIFLVETKNLPILTQAQLIADFSHAKKDLVSMRRVFEVLEMIDSLLIEEDVQERVFSHALAILEHLNSQEITNHGFVRAHLSAIVEILGFADREELVSARPLRDFVEEVTQRKMKAYAYLSS
jgi:DNA repair protein RecO (recombination protein O)